MGELLNLSKLLSHKLQSEWLVERTYGEIANAIYNDILRRPGWSEDSELDATIADTVAVARYLLSGDMGMDYLIEITAKLLHDS